MSALTALAIRRHGSPAARRRRISSESTSRRGRPNGSTAPRTPLLSAAEPRHHAVTDQAALKLRDRAEQMEQEPARRCGGGVHSLVDDHKVDAEGLEFASEGDKMVKAPSEPIELGDHDHGHVAATRGGEERVQGRAAFLRAAHALVGVLDRVPAARRRVLAEGFKLDDGLLVGGGDARVKAGTLPSLRGQFRRGFSLRVPLPFCCHCGGRYGVIRGCFGVSRRAAEMRGKGRKYLRIWW
jgi:hypothetical protein